jgi:hypothetical protein
LLEGNLGRLPELRGPLVPDQRGGGRETSPGYVRGGVAEPAVMDDGLLVEFLVLQDETGIAMGPQTDGGSNHALHDRRGAARSTGGCAGLATATAPGAGTGGRVATVVFRTAHP